MIFVSFWFVAFAAIFLPLYWALPLPRLRLVLLVLGCAVFHTHFAGPAGVLPILVLGMVTYGIGLTRRPAWCVGGALVCVGALVFYKYTHFLSVQVLGVLSPALGQAADQWVISALPIVPPLAISFFVFEFVHYLLDIRRGTEPLRNPLHFLAFAIFWPSIVAGPIKRYEQFVPALTRGVQRVTGPDVVLGLGRVCTGLVKKTIADGLAPWLDYYAPQFETLDLTWRWVFFVFLAVRIYFDFAGYSDIAIGYARMMGIVLPENFNWPYLSRSIGEFWRRWHMSLSSWIRDYIYIPLGGNRHGLARRSMHAVIAFGLCGLWHGADWNYLVWGLYHGLGLVVCSTYAWALGPFGHGLRTFFKRVPLAGGILTFLFVGFGWLLFFYPVSTALRMAVLLVTPGNG